MGTEERYEFNEVTLLAPFAIGVPGKRTFFLGIGDKNSWVRVWLEKEHLQALNQGIEELLLILSREHISLPQEEAPQLSDKTPTELPSAELDIVQMTLGWEEEKAIIEIVVQRTGAQEKELGAVYARVSVSQLKKLQSQSSRVCAAGRPLCPVCGGPIDQTGHICPGEN